MPHADAAPVLVFDLDETILRVNSFPLWVGWLIGGRLPGLGWRRRAALSLQVQWLVLRRKSGRIDHDRFLRGVQRTWRDATGDHAEAMAAPFQAALLRQVRDNMQKLLAAVAQDHLDAVLATAAAADYADGLARMLGFQHALTTAFDDAPAARRNAGETKRDRVLALLRELDWHLRPILLFTDHGDDLPLIRRSSAVCWFGSMRTMTAAQDAVPGATFVACAAMDADALLATLLALGMPRQAAMRSEITVS
jgi:phosphoserine phosphatase